MAEGKREAGAIPARSRHCDKGVGGYLSLRKREGCRLHLTFKSGNLPFIGTQAKAWDHEALIVPFIAQPIKLCRALDVKV